MLHPPRLDSVVAPYPAALRDEDAVAVEATIALGARIDDRDDGAFARLVGPEVGVTRQVVRVSISRRCHLSSHEAFEVLAGHRTVLPR